MSATETLVDITLFRLRDTSDRHASDRNERIASALEQIQDVGDKAEKRKKGTGDKARSSTTDPDARRMRMVDGGFVSRDDITAIEQKETTVFTPVKEEHSAASLSSCWFWKTVPPVFNKRQNGTTTPHGR